MAKAKKAKTKKAATTKAAKTKKATAEERIDNLATLLDAYRNEFMKLNRKINQQAREITTLTNKATHRENDARAHAQEITRLSQAQKDAQNNQQGCEGMITSLENAHDRSEKQIDLLTGAMGDVQRSMLAFTGAPTITAAEKLNREADEATGEPTVAQSIADLKQKANYRENDARHQAQENTALKASVKVVQERLDTMETVLTDLDSTQRTPAPLQGKPPVAARSITITY